MSNMILALDYGARYVGMAVTDEGGGTALRHGVIDQKEKKVLDEVKKIVEDKEIKKVLVGVPVGLDGEETEQTHECLAFMEDLRIKLGDGVEVESVDETFTSIEAGRRIEAEGADKHEIHAEAARLMLASYMM